ncbi:MAG: aminotransferase class I/II-fold pyridoxal phosphate-dependent enzyme [Chitinophagales bacterium]|nr:aminotransferase class I/II-fold pyridoxal phosphate-dependent enzyme [Chitinophagales bacterium]
MNQSQHFDTQAIRTQTQRTWENEHSTPLFMTSSFVFDNAEDMRAAFAEENDHNIYSRFSNPTVDEFVQKMVLLEEAESGYATASGMSAVFGTFMSFLQSGDHILSSGSVFGSTHTILTKYMGRWKIEYDYFDVNKPELIESLIRPNTKMLYIETPSNPGLDIVDMDMLSALAKKHHLIFVVDNCFATPALQKPMLHGADIVIHSATKWIDGQGRVVGGVIVGKKALIREIYLFLRNTGPSMSPFNAWVLSKSLETLSIRMERHCNSALQIARTLESNPHLEWVKYPFLESHPQHKIAWKQMKAGGGIVCFELKGGLARGQKFLDALQMLSRTANLGDSRSIASHPSSTTHSKLTEAERLSVGITSGLIRISVGLEHPDDILKDIQQALEASSK